MQEIYFWIKQANTCISQNWRKRQNVNLEMAALNMLHMPFKNIMAFSLFRY